MGQEEVIKYLKKEIIVSSKEIEKMAREECSLSSVHNALRRLVEHNEIVKFKIGF